jgi:hypothetical protein
MNFILTYLFLGVLWTMYFEYIISPKQMNNFDRIRQIIFWIIPAGAWVIGFIIGFVNHIIDFFKNNQ